MATLSDVRTKVRDRLDESTATFWTDAQLNRWINDGMREVARLTETLQTTSDIAVTASDGTYTAPTDALRIYRAEFKPTGQSNVYPLEYRDFNTMDEVWWSSQTTTTGTPALFTMWGFVPSLTIQLYPVPSVAGTLKVFYYKLPTAVSADNDTIECPAGWEDLIVDYAEYNALRKDRDPRWQEAKGLFEQHVDQCTALTRRWSDQVGSWGVDAPVGLPAWLIDPGF